MNFNDSRPASTQLMNFNNSRPAFCRDRGMGGADAGALCLSSSGCLSLPDNYTHFLYPVLSGIVKGGKPFTWGLGLCPNFLFSLFCAAAGARNMREKKHLMALPSGIWLRSPRFDICV